MTNSLYLLNARQTMRVAETDISTDGWLVSGFDPSQTYLMNPNDKAYKKAWKGTDQYLVSGVYRNKVMLRGNPLGVPICYLKGGPGSAPLSSGQKRYWQPDCMRLALSSWRGCGDSTPSGGIQSNTTDDLVEDVEAMRVAMNVPALLLAGQCWGAAVAFKYAAKYPKQTLGIVAMLPYLARQEDIEQSFGPEGIAKKYPSAYADFVADTGASDLPSLFAYYAQCLNGDLRSPKAIKAFEKWLNWEITSSGDEGRVSADRLDNNSKQYLWEAAGERININYVKNGYFLPASGVTDALCSVNEQALSGKPILMVAHRNDPLSSPSYMDTLKRLLPNAAKIIFENTQWHWIAPGKDKPGSLSSHQIENAFAFMVSRAATLIKQRSQNGLCIR